MTVLTAEQAHIKPTRWMKRTLLVLLTGAPGLGNGTIWQVYGYGRVPIAELVRLVNAGWAERYREEPPPLNRPQRTFYRLTPYGRRAAFRVLGLTPPEDVP
jgi:hypothetical protein